MSVPESTMRIGGEEQEEKEAQAMEVWLTIGYGMVILGSVGLMDFARRFPSVTKQWELEYSGEKALGLFDGYQVWSGSWRFIIFGTVMQMAAVWMWD